MTDLSEKECISCEGGSSSLEYDEIHKDTGKIFFLTDDGSLWKMEKK